MPEFRVQVKPLSPFVQPVGRPLVSQPATPREVPGVYGEGGNGGESGGGDADGGEGDGETGGLPHTQQLSSGKLKESPVVHSEPGETAPFAHHGPSNIEPVSSLN